MPAHARVELPGSISGPVQETPQFPTPCVTRIFSAILRPEQPRLGLTEGRKRVEHRNLPGGWRRSRIRVPQHLMTTLARQTQKLPVWGAPPRRPLAPEIASKANQFSIHVTRRRVSSERVMRDCGVLSLGYWINQYLPVRRPLPGNYVNARAIFESYGALCCVTNGGRNSR